MEGCPKRSILKQSAKEKRVFYGPQINEKDRECAHLDRGFERTQRQEQTTLTNLEQVGQTTTFPHTSGENKLYNISLEKQQPVQAWNGIGSCGVKDNKGLKERMRDGEGGTLVLCLEVLLSEEEPCSVGGRVFVGLDVQRLRDCRWTAEEDSNIRIGVFLS